MNGGAWWSIVHGVAKSWTQLKWLSMHWDMFKKKSLLILCFSFTLTLLIPDVWGFFPQQAVLHDIGSEVYHCTQFWHSVSEDGIRPHRLRAQSHKTVPTHIPTRVLGLLNQSMCSVAQSCMTLCNPIDCGIPGFPVLHHLLELAQTHIHWVSDANQPSLPCHPLLFLPSIFPGIRVFSKESTFGKKKIVDFWHQVAKVLELQLQHQSFQQKSIEMNRGQTRNSGKTLLGDFSGGPVVKNLPAIAGDISLIPGLERFCMPQSN